MAIIKAYFSTHPILAPSLVALVIVIATGLSGYGLSKQKTVLLSQRLRLEERKRDLELLDKILADQQLYETKIQAINRTVPKNYEEVSNVVSNIERVAAANQQEFETQLEQDAQPESGGLSSIKLTLKTVGSYADFSQMMSGLSRLPYHTRVDALQIDEAGGKAEAVVTLRLFITER